VIQLEKFFKPIYQPQYDLADNASVMQRLAAEQNTNAYLRKLRDNADVQIIVKRNPQLDAGTNKLVLYDESYGCKVLGGKTTQDLIFKRLN
jgi:hypothetical protein